MNPEQTYNAIVADLEPAVERWGNSAIGRRTEALLNQVEWLWDQYLSWENGGGDGELFEARLTAMARDLGVLDD